MIDYSLLASVLSEQWNISVRKESLLQERDGQQVFLVFGDTGKYIVKVYASGMSQDQVAANTRILEMINLAGYPSPQQLPSVTGAFWGHWNNRFLTVQLCLEGTTPLPDETGYAQLGAMIAKLHTLNTVGAPFANLEMKAELLRKELYRKGETFGADQFYFTIVDGLPDFSNLPKAIIHTDLELRNVIQQQDGTFALIDWDDSGVGIALLDLAYCVVSLLHPIDGLNIPCARSFYARYIELRPITSQEYQLFGQAVAYWLLSYMYIDGVGLIGTNRDKLIHWQENKHSLIPSIFPESYRNLR